MAYPASFLTRTSFSRTRLYYTGGTAANNLNTQLDAYIAYLNGTTAKDMLINGSFAAKGLYPHADATYPLGDATYGFTALSLDNGAADGGTIYFDGGTTAYLQCNAAGTTLSTGGVTGFSAPIEGASVDIVQSENSDVDDGETMSLVFDFVPSKIVLTYHGVVNSAGGNIGHNHGQSIITITGTDTFTVRNNSSVIREDNAAAITATGNFADTTNVLTLNGGLDPTTSTINGTATWTTSTKTLLITFAGSNINASGNILDVVATAYK